MEVSPGALLPGLPPKLLHLEMLRRSRMPGTLRLHRTFVPPLRALTRRHALSTCLSPCRNRGEFYGDPLKRTCCGTLERSLVPLPNCPYSLSPQVQNVPS